MAMTSTEVPTALSDSGRSMVSISRVSGEEGTRAEEVVDNTHSLNTPSSRVSVRLVTKNNIMQVRHTLSLSSEGSSMDSHNRSTASTQAVPAANTSKQTKKNQRSPQSRTHTKSPTPRGRKSVDKLPLLTAKRASVDTVKSLSVTRSVPGSSNQSSPSRTVSRGSGGAGRAGGSKGLLSRRSVGESSRPTTPALSSPVKRRAMIKSASPANAGKRLGGVETGRKGVGGALPRRQQKTPQKGKGKWRKLYQALSHLEEKQRANIDQIYDAEWNQMILDMSIDSFEPHRRALLYAQNELVRLKREYEAKASRAEGATTMLAQGTFHLLETVSKTAVNILKESEILDVVLPLEGQDITANATILACSKDPSSLEESHASANRVSPSERSEIEQIKTIFSILTQNTNGENETVPMDADNVVGSAHEVYDKTIQLSKFLAALLNRTFRMLQRSKKVNETLQYALDEEATRVKVADEILRGIVMKQEVDVDSAIGLCQQFSMELRRRMDKMEKDVRDALDELIQRSVVVSIDNNGFNDQAQLLRNKENTIQHYMSKMETVAVEQGKLLQEVRFKLLQLWKRRCGVGDEERATLKHSGLPKAYRELLQGCDRDTLIRLLHFVSLNSDDAPALLIGAIDEHCKFLHENTAEAQALVQREAMESAVRLLLEKLHEEGDIRQNPCRKGTTLSETINDMVLHYNTYMTTLEKQQRGAAQRKSMKEASSRRPFFHRGTPLPAEYAAALAERPMVEMKRPAICDGKANRLVRETMKNGEKITVLNKSTQLNEISEVRPTKSHIETCHLLSHLRGAHPSAFDPPGTATVVGFGRWGGTIARRSDESYSCTNPCRSFESPPGVPDHPKGANNSDHWATLSPGVPPRVSFVQHVLNRHSHDLETLLTNPQQHCKCIPGGDEPFLKLQRELLEVFQ